MINVEVRLIGTIPHPEFLVTQAMLSCQNIKPAFSLAPSDEKCIEMINKAIASGHESVLEHANFTFSVEGISRACSHQLVRHRIASYSQQSQRHVDPTKDPEWFVTPKTLEGSKVIGDSDSIYVELAYRIFMSNAAEMYARLVKVGIPEEDARFVLPNACKTNIVITMNARELRHFFRLRCHPSAQWEIREMANRMLEEVRRVAPNIFKAESQ